jgi:Uma2 family endonuclease
MARQSDARREIRMTIRGPGRRNVRRALLLRPAPEAHLMGMPASSPPVTTIEELLALPDDGQRHELLDGMHVVTPAPRYIHQRALGELLVRLHAALAGRADVELLQSPADIVLGPRTLVQPDLFVIRRTPGVRPERWTDVGVPLVAIEVLSPTTAPRDRGAKRRTYQRAGVAQYWIVDLDARLIERWRPDDARPEMADERLDWSLPGGAAGTLDVRRYFATVWED